MRRLIQLVLVTCLGLLVVTALAQSVTVSVDPASGTRGTNFTITATGLQANTSYTFDVIISASGRVAFTTERQSTAEGVASLSLRSEASDTLGDYQVQVKSGNTVLGDVTFTLVEESSQPTPAPLPTALPTVPAVNPNSTVQLRINPLEDVARSTFQISVAGLTAGDTVWVVVTEDATGTVTYERDWVANDAGNVQVDLYTTTDSALGSYTVSIEQEDRSVLASGQFTLLESGGRDGLVTIEPVSGSAGTTFTLSLTKINSFTDVAVKVIDPATGLVVFNTVVKTDVDGKATVTFVSTSDLAEQTYRVEASDIDGLVAQADLSIGVATSPDALKLTVQPSDGSIGRVVTVSALGLTPNSTVTIRIMVNGEEYLSFTPKTNKRGATSITFKTQDGDPIGTYSAEVEANGAVVISQDFNVSEAVVVATPEPTVETPTSTFTLTIDPVEGVKGTDHTVTLAGLNANDAVSFNVLFDGTSVFTSDKTADANGVATLVLTSSDSDATGTYTVEASVNNAVVATGDLVISDATTAQATPSATPATVSGDVSVSIDPVAGDIGTSHVVTVSGLSANQAFTLNVLFDNVSQYSTDRVADANGNFSMRLKAEEGDSLGVYTVEIVINQATVASADFTTTAATTAQVTPAPTTTPEPTTAQANSSERIVLDGTLTTSAPTYTTQIDAVAGEVFNISAVSGDVDTYLQLLDVDGYELTYNDDGTDGSTNSAISAYVIPYDGTFTVSVTSYDNYFGYDTALVGDVTLTIDKVVVSDIAYDQPISVALNGDSPSQLLGFDATAGDVISVVATGDGVDSVLSIIDATGYEVATDDDGGVGYDPEIVRYVVPSDGRYLLRISTFDMGSNGNVVVTVKRNGVNTLDNGSKKVMLNTKQYSDVVTFAGQAGDVVNLTITLVSGKPNDLTIYTEQNTSTVMSYTSNYGIPDTFSLPIVVPDDGVVRVTLSTSGGNCVLDVSVGK